MSFLSPAAFLFLLSLPLIFLFHLLRIRRQEATVSSTRAGVAPASKPRWAASWFTRPSASGSLKGTPSSSTSTAA